YYDGRLFSTCTNFPLDLLFLRDDDIPEYVEEGVTDLGIAGLNIVHEYDSNVVQLEKLGFSGCRLCIAVPKRSGVSDVKQLNGKRIATSYPSSLQRYLRERGLDCEIVKISGSVEITPSLNVAEAICDLVSTGSTLRLNDLEPIETILQSEAVLIGNPDSFKDSRKRELIERLRVRARGTLKARNTKYVMMNVPNAKLEEVEGILPGMKSPTVMPLAHDDMSAVHSAVPEEDFWDVIERLKQAGAEDILVVPVEKMVL
ncbi:MAG TPA: ATP phosphoribosyltransferase, partial [Acidobacteriota bacterium]|nr:ATP phosphoribosyltransferase [Acidobacteriota bacterium]